ncbi:MAG: hypothetical protein Q9218_005589 [Villophora microphyllina]
MKAENAPNTSAPGPPLAPGPTIPKPMYERNELRVAHATLLYRTHSDLSTWVQLPETYSREIKGQENLLSVSLLNGGIELCQEGNPKTEDKGGLWKVRFEKGQYDRVHFDEYDKLRHPGTGTIPYVAIQFRVTATPKGWPEDSSTNDDGGSSALACRPWIPTPLAVQRSISGPKPHRFPLARVSEHFTEDGYAEFMVFFFKSRKQSGPKTWSWPAAAELLSGKPAWITAANKQQREVLNSLDLASFAARTNGNKKLTFSLGPANRGFWLVSRGTPGPFPAIASLPDRAHNFRPASETAASIRAIQRRGLEQDVADYGDAYAKYFDAWQRKKKQLAEMEHQDETAEDDEITEDDQHRAKRRRLEDFGCLKEGE